MSATYSIMDGSPYMLLLVLYNYCHCFIHVMKGLLDKVIILD